MSVAGIVILIYVIGAVLSYLRINASWYDLDTNELQSFDQALCFGCVIFMSYVGFAFGIWLYFEQEEKTFFKWK